MPKKPNPIPEGFRTITPHISIKNASAAIEFYKKAFGAQEHCRMLGPDGKAIMHAVIQIGDSVLMLNDEFPNMGCLSPTTLKGSPVAIHLYVDNVDVVFNRAVKAGAKTTLPVQDMFWGDRYGKLEDPFGHQWSIATHKEDVSPEEMSQRSQSAFAAK